MAITNINKDAYVSKLTKYNGYEVSSDITFTALTALNSTNDADIYVATTGANGIEFTLDDRDDKYVLLLQNCAETAATVLIKKGDNPSYSAGADLSISLTAATGSTTKLADVLPIKAVNVDTAKYGTWDAKNPRGKGKLVVVGSATTVKVALVKLA